MADSVEIARLEDGSASIFCGCRYEGYGITLGPDHVSELIAFLQDQLEP